MTSTDAGRVTFTNPDGEEIPAADARTCACGVTDHKDGGKGCASCEAWVCDDCRRTCDICEETSCRACLEYNERRDRNECAACRDAEDYTKSREADYQWIVHGR